MLLHDGTEFERTQRASLHCAQCLKQSEKLMISKHPKSIADLSIINRVKITRTTSAYCSPCWNPESTHRFPISFYGTPVQLLSYFLYFSHQINTKLNCCRACFQHSSERKTVHVIVTFAYWYMPWDPRSTHKIWSIIKRRAFRRRQHLYLGKVTAKHDSSCSHSCRLPLNTYRASAKNSFALPRLTNSRSFM